jgi:hypothetical protein
MISLFYIGYLIAQYPTNLLMQRFPTGKYLTVNFVLWGNLFPLTFLLTGPQVPCSQPPVAQEVSAALLLLASSLEFSNLVSTPGLS